MIFIAFVLNYNFGNFLTFIALVLNDNFVIFYLL